MRKKPSWDFVWTDEPAGEVPFNEGYIIFIDEWFYLLGTPKLILKGSGKAVAWN